MKKGEREEMNEPQKASSSSSSSKLPGVLQVDGDKSPTMGSTANLLRSSSSLGKQKASCLCSPTKHIGSFRCRHHRNAAAIRRSAVSVSSALSEYANEAASARMPPRTSLSNLAPMAPPSMSNMP